VGGLAQPVATERGLEGFVRVDRLPVPDAPVLALGREVWGDTCQNCHGGNRLTGAPKITATRDWAPRIDKGLDQLVTHAIGGFMGPKFMEMPARGGNAALTDGDVAAAVAFMVWASGGSDLVLSSEIPYQTKD
jgi:cytochrome c5